MTDAPFGVFICYFWPTGSSVDVILQPAACLDVASNRNHHHGRPRGLVSRLVSGLLWRNASILCDIGIISYRRGEIQQHVVVRIPSGKLGNGITFILVLPTHSVLAIFEPFLCLAGSVSPPQPQVGTRNCLFQCRPRATRRLSPRREKKLKKQKDALTEQHQEHHDILHIKIHDITNQKPPNSDRGEQIPT